MIKLRSVFSDHALFASSSALTVSGCAGAGSKIAFALTSPDGRDVLTADTVCDADGRFAVTFRTPQASFDAYSFRFSENGETALTVSDVVFGELWLASGQSNMEMQNYYMAENAEMYRALAERGIRIFVQDWAGGLSVSKADFEKLGGDFHSYTDNWLGEYLADAVFPTSPAEDCGGRWIVCDADDVSLLERVSALASSAVREIYDALGNTPVGFVNSSVGGTVIESWLPEDAVTGNAKYMQYLAENGKSYDSAVLNDTSRETYRQPSCLYNLKIAPLSGVKFSGIFWYQGESNCQHRHAYEFYCEALAIYRRAYREMFAAHDSFAIICGQIFPYLYDELGANVSKINRAIADVCRAHDDMATFPIHDMPARWVQGRNHPLHPRHKYALGKRFAEIAVRAVYNGAGRRSAASAVNYSFDGKNAYVRFDGGQDELELRSPHGFRIAGTDGVYHDAFAELTDGVLKLSHPAVQHPAACSYMACDMDMFPSLFCGGLPVNCFASDADHPACENHSWLFPELDSVCAVTESGDIPDFFARPTWRTDGETELCRDTAYASGAAAIRLRGEAGRASAYVPAYPGARLDLDKFTALSFDVSRPHAVRVKLYALAGDKRFDLPAGEMTAVSDDRVNVRIPLTLPGDFDAKTCEKLVFSFENEDKSIRLCTVALENFILW